MPLTLSQQMEVLQSARALIGNKYSDMDCSHFVNLAYVSACLPYPYKATADFDDLVDKYFTKLETPNLKLEPGDIVMFPGHMGLWDPLGCKVLQDAGTGNAQCKRLNNDLPFLSSRSSNNRGPDFGMMKWFGTQKAVYRWSAKTP